MRGAGEKEIETDRRVVNDKIAKLKEKLVKIDKQNFTRRKSRGKMIRVALVGYTNVGKSTLMSLLSKSDVFAENKLFATVDTIVRKVAIQGIPFLLSDTVGFIRKLPHHLIESFKSTLDEVRESDILLHVVDVSHTQFEEQMKVVNQTLTDLNVIDKKTFIIFNKFDLYRVRNLDEYLADEVKEEIISNLKQSWRKQTDDHCVFISALQKENIDEMKELLMKEVKVLYHQRYPYQAGYYEADSPES